MPKSPEHPPVEEAMAPEEESEKLTDDFYIRRTDEMLGEIDQFLENASASDQAMAEQELENRESIRLELEDYKKKLAEAETGSDQHHAKVLRDLVSATEHLLKSKDSLIDRILQNIEKRKSQEEN